MSRSAEFVFVKLIWINKVFWLNYLTTFFSSFCEVLIKYTDTVIPCGTKTIPANNRKGNN